MSLRSLCVSRRKQNSLLSCGQIAFLCVCVCVRVRATTVLPIHPVTGTEAVATSWLPEVCCTEQGVHVSPQTPVCFSFGYMCSDSVVNFVRNILPSATVVEPACTPASRAPVPPSPCVFPTTCCLSPFGRQPFLQMGDDISLWFQFASLVTAMNIFPCTRWPSGGLLRKNGYLVPMPIFKI